MRKQLRTASCRLFLPFLIGIVISHFAIAHSPNFDVHGFASVAATYTDKNRFFGDSEDVSLDFYELGLNGYFRPHQRLAFSGQVMARDAGAVDDGDLRVDYLFADLTLLNTDSLQAGSRIGRVKNPYGFYNETGDVIFTRPSILMPTSVYFNASGALRDLTFASDGAELYGTLSTGNWVTSLSVVGARKYNAGSRVRKNLFAPESTFAGPETDVSWDDLFFARALTETVGGTLRFAYSVFNNRLLVKRDAFNGPGVVGLDLDTINQVFSAQLNREKWSLTAEYRVQDSRQKLTLQIGDLTIPLQPYQTTCGEGAYVQYDRKFNLNWSAFARFDALYVDCHDHDGSEFEAQTGMSGKTRYSEGFGFGLKYTPRPRWGIWTEIHRFEGTAALPQRDNRGRAVEDPWTMFLLNFAVRF